MTAPTLDEVLDDIHHLPSLPELVMELIHTLDNEAAGINQLAAGIAKDQSLAARALRVANSPFYGIQHKVASIHEAIVILGFRAVGSLVMAASVTDFFSLPSHIAFNRVHFWHHGIGVALCARALAQDAGLDAEAAFTAGLLHDIGVLALLTARPAHYEQVLEYRSEHDCELIGAEQSVLGFDHARVGAALAQRWRFPTKIARAVALHHCPGRAADDPVSHLPALPPDEQKLIDVVHVANILAHALDLAGDPNAQVPPLDGPAWEHLGLSRSRLKTLLAAIEQEHESYCALLKREE